MKKKLIIFLFSYYSFVLGQFPANYIVPDTLINNWKISGHEIFSNNLFIDTFYVNDLDSLLQINNEYYIESKDLIELINNLDTNIFNVIMFDGGICNILLNQDFNFINIPSNTIIVGKGEKETILKLKAENNKSTNFFKFLGTNSGIENLTIDAENYFDQTVLKDDTLAENLCENKYLIGFFGSRQCWVKGVKFNYGLGTTVLIFKAHHITISGCHFKDTWIHGNHNNSGTQGYGIVFDGSSNSFSSHCKIENNIFENFRHAIVIQYYAKYNVIGYNYTKGSYAYNYVGSIQIPWATSDVVLHGNSPSLNLFESNYFEGNNNAKGITIDNVKATGNGKYNTLYRNYSNDMLRVQHLNCAYNKNQCLVANQSRFIDIRGEDHIIYNNLDSNSLMLDYVGVNCADGNDFINNDDYSSLGVSCYLNGSTCWLNYYDLPFLGVGNQAMMKIPAMKRYFEEITTYNSCDTINSAIFIINEFNNIQIIKNPVSDYLEIFSQIDYRVCLLDFKGSLIWEDKLSNKTLIKDISSLNRGIYFLCIYSDSNKIIETKKIIKN